MRRTLDRFSEVHELPSIEYSRSSHCDERCAILNLRPAATGPADHAADVGRLLFLEGDVYGPEDLLPGNGSAADLLALEGEAFSRLNGGFNIVVYRRREHRIDIYNDVLARRPLYYATQGGGLLFASEKKAILAAMNAAPRLDSLGLLEVFAFGHNLDDRTLVEGIRSLPPGAHLTWQRDELRIDRRPGIQFGALEIGLLDRGTIAEMVRRLELAVQRTLRQRRRVALSLSGGLDSRALACAIPRDFRPIVARTFGNRGSSEVSCAERVARALRFQHVVEDPNLRFSHYVPAIVWRTEGGISFLGCMSLPGHAALREQADALMSGNLGGPSSGMHIKPFMLWPRGASAFRDAVYRDRARLADLREIFTNRFLETHVPALREAFARSLAHADSETNVQTYELWDLTVRQPRGTFNASAVDSHLFDDLVPFADREYLDLALSLPTPLRVGQLAYMSLVHRIGSEVRDIPYANTGRLVRASIAGNVLHKGGYLLDYVKAKAGAIPWTDSDAVDYAAAMRRDAGLSILLRRFLASEICDGTVFDRPRIQRLLERFHGGQANIARPISLLVTFALALDYFIMSPRRRCPAEAFPLPDAGGSPRLSPA